MIPNSELRSGAETFHLWAAPGTLGGKDPILFLVEIEDDMNLVEHVGSSGTLSGNTVLAASRAHGPRLAERLAHQRAPGAPGAPSSPLS